MNSINTTLLNQTAHEISADSSCSLSSATLNAVIGLIGINYRSAPLSIREKVSSFFKAHATKLKEVQEGGLILESAILTTCNRTEILFVASKENFTLAEQCIMSLFLSALDNKSINSIYHLKDEKAVEHVFKVATGLDSMIMGESQILGQLKNAYRSAVHEQTVNSLLHRLFQGAFKTAKRVRSRTGIGRGTVSLAYAVRETLGSVYGDLSSLKVLIIGAGETATLVSRHLRTSGVESFFVANRTKERGLSLSNSLLGTLILLHEVPEILPMVDIIISAVDGMSDSDYIVPYSIVAKDAFTDASRTKCLIDLSVPRSIDPKVSELESVYLFDIDDFSEIICNNTEKRGQEAVKALYIVEEETQSFLLWQKERNRYQLIEKLQDKFEQASEKDASRIQRNLVKRGFSDQEVGEILEELSAHEQAVVKKFLHPLFNRIRGDLSPENLTFFEELFGLSLERKSID